jgi:hypothetical protein
LPYGSPIRRRMMNYGKGIRVTPCVNGVFLLNSSCISLSICYTIPYMKYYDYKGELCSEKYYIQFRDEFVSKCQALLNDHNRNHSWETKITIKNGRKYDKMITSEDSSDIGDRSNSRVFAFINKTNGDILKPAHWNKPAQHARGNIYDENPMLFIHWTGPAYMDTIKRYYGEIQ